MIMHSQLSLETIENLRSRHNIAYTTKVVNNRKHILEFSFLSYFLTRIFSMITMLEPSLDIRM